MGFFGYFCWNARLVMQLLENLEWTEDKYSELIYLLQILLLGSTNSLEMRNTRVDHWGQLNELL